MYLGITRVGSLSVADTEVEEPTTSGRPVDDRVDSLISRIRPARHSEQRRHRVAKYVSNLITRCFQADHEVRTVMSHRHFIGQEKHRSSLLLRWRRSCLDQSLSRHTCRMETLICRCFSPKAVLCETAGPPSYAQS